MFITKEQLETLEQVDLLLNPSYEINTVYMTPAQAMRKAADDLEEEEKLKRKFKEIIKETKESMKPTKEPKCYIAVDGAAFPTFSGPFPSNNLIINKP